MIESNRKLIAVLVFPILALMFLTGYKSYLWNTGQEVILPITGYDPRDLLSGHYLTYRVEYGIENLCGNQNGHRKRGRDGYVCLNPKQFSFYPMDSCTLVIKGSCDGFNRFEAGIERYYIPEDRAKPLDKDVREGKASIVVSVQPSGKAQIKDLLIDGKPWRD